MLRELVNRRRAPGRHRSVVNPHAYAAILLLTAGHGSIPSSVVLLGDLEPLEQLDPVTERVRDVRPDVARERFVLDDRNVRSAAAREQSLEVEDTQRRMRLRCGPEAGLDPQMQLP